MAETLSITQQKELGACTVDESIRSRLAAMEDLMAERNRQIEKNMDDILEVIRSIQREFFSDPIAKLNQLKETNGIASYHKEFDFLRSRANLSEEYLVSAYLKGLDEDTQVNIKMFQPRTVNQCFMIGRLYEIAHPRKIVCATENKSEVEKMPQVHGDVTVECGSIGEQVEDVSDASPGEDRVLETRASIQDTSEMRTKLMLGNPQDDEAQGIQKQIQLQEMDELVEEYESQKSDGSNKEIYSVPKSQVSFSVLEPSLRCINSSRFIIENLQEVTMRINLLQAGFECVMGKKDALQMFDEMLVIKQKLQAKKKSEELIKTWKFKFKISIKHACKLGRVLDVWQIHSEWDFFWIMRWEVARMFQLCKKMNPGLKLLLSLGANCELLIEGLDLLILSQLNRGISARQCILATRPILLQQMQQWCRISATNCLKSVVMFQLVSERCTSLIDIKPWSASGRIGLANQDNPFQVPHCIARHTTQTTNPSVFYQKLNILVTMTQHVDCDKACKIVTSLKIQLHDEGSFYGSASCKRGRVDNYNQPSVTTKKDAAFNGTDLYEDNSLFILETSAGGSGAAIHVIDPKSTNESKQKYEKMILGEEAMKIFLKQSSSLHRPNQRSHGVKSCPLQELANKKRNSVFGDSLWSTSWKTTILKKERLDKDWWFKYKHRGITPTEVHHDKF